MLSNYYGRQDTDKVKNFWQKHNAGFSAMSKLWNLLDLQNIFKEDFLLLFKIWNIILKTQYVHNLNFTNITG